MWALLALAATASADMQIEGERIRVHYNDYGTWNAGTWADGFQINEGGSWRDVSFPGSPWQQLGFEWDQGGSSHAYEGNYASGGWGWAMDETLDLSSGDHKEAMHRWQMGNLEVIKTEMWQSSEQILLISFQVTNNGSSDATNFRMMHAVDPDQDADTHGNYSTDNDVYSDGMYLEMVGSSSGLTFSYGLCDSDDELGITGWDTDVDTTLEDPDGASQDWTGHWRHTEDSLAVGDSFSVSFVVTWGTNASTAYSQYTDNWMSICGMCDADEDGYDNASCDGTDCDDTDASVNPGATEVCDDIDNDCDGTVDEDDAADATTWYMDADSDGFGDPAVTEQSCDTLSGYVTDSTDCNDGDGAVHPDATEVCDGQDNDCDGTIDENDASDASTWYMDSDGDGFGDADYSLVSCDADDGYVSDATDCDDSDGAVNPDATEVCDDIDNDCDGTIDEDDASDASTWYLDADSDDFGDASTATLACEAPEDHVSDGTDCDDGREFIYPGAPEFCDGYDNDCDGETDEDEASDLSEWAMDMDGDGYAEESVTVESCDPPDGYMLASDSMGEDCDDEDADIHPGAEEIWYDGIDSDCDGESDFDADLDGHDLAEAGGDTGDTGLLPAGDDCDDEDPDVHPDAEETWYDGIDSDCDGESDFDADMDGHDSETYDGDDCDDADPDTYPGAPDEPGDGVVTDCDDADEYDADGDGYDSEESGGDDCDDASGDIHPGAEDIPDDGIDQDCDGADATTEDTGDVTDDTGDLPDDTGDLPDDTGDGDTDADDTGGDNNDDDDDDDDDDEDADGETGSLPKDGCSCSTGGTLAGSAGGVALGFLSLLGAAVRRRD